MNDYYVISVESRKGGVGKTTAALNLAKLLIDEKAKKYAVLLLDADITGTNIANCINSPFWKDCTKILSKKTRKSKDDRLNLLELFDKHFMAGKHIYPFSTGANDNRKCEIKLDKVNIIGSQIYNNKSDNKNGNHYCICSPSILFDELHSFWFVEFLKELCEEFYRATSKQNKSTETVIVIDNSPGFVGISPTIHQWLTDIGPERGKFLTVSTLDEQDFISCCYAVNGIHELLSGKHETASQLKNILPYKDKSINAEPEIENMKFFLRLLEENRNKKDSELKYYLALNKSDKQYLFIEEPFRYQNWIINRVPREIKKGLMEHDADRILGSRDDIRDKYELPRRIWEQNKNVWGEIPRSHLISYDEYIEWQFLRNIFDVNERHFRDVGRQWHFGFEQFKEKLYSLKRVSLVEIVPYPEKRALPVAAFRELHEFIKKAQQISEEAVNFLNFFGPSYLFRLIRNEWFPEYPFNLLRDTFGLLAREADFPFPRQMEIQFEGHRFSDEYFHEAEYLYHHLNERIYRYIREDDLGNMRQLFFAYTYVVIWGTGIVSFRKPFHGKASDFFAMILLVLHENWKKYRKKHQKPNLQEFLANEKFNEKDFFKPKEKFMEMEHMFDRYIFRRDRSSFHLFYTALCRAQARVIDLHEDTEFLFYVIQKLLEMKSKVHVLPYIRAVLEDVIEKKAISHHQGKKQCAKGFAEASYMQEFMETLSLVAKKWEMV